MNFRTVFVILAAITLTGCDPVNIKPSSTDLKTVLDVRQRADQAYQQEDWSTAEREYRYLVENVPNDAEPWFRLGNIYARTGRLDAAVVAYREALVRDSKSSKAWHNLGIVQLRQASGTFVEMQQYTAPDDPLRERAQQVLNHMDALMSGFNTTNPE